MLERNREIPAIAELPLNTEIETEYFWCSIVFSVDGVGSLDVHAPYRWVDVSDDELADDPDYWFKQIEYDREYWATSIVDEAWDQLKQTYDQKQKR